MRRARPTSGPTPSPIIISAPSPSATKSIPRRCGSMSGKGLLKPSRSDRQHPPLQRGRPEAAGDHPQPDPRPGRQPGRRRGHPQYAPEYRAHRGRGQRLPRLRPRPSSFPGAGRRVRKPADRSLVRTAPGQAGQVRKAGLNGIPRATSNPRTCASTWRKSAVFAQVGEGEEKSLGERIHARRRGGPQPADRGQPALRRLLRQEIPGHGPRPARPHQRGQPRADRGGQALRSRAATSSSSPTPSGGSARRSSTP